MSRTWFTLGALIAGLAVAAGAMGAHALEGKLDEAQLRSYETAVRYQMFHGVALLIVGLMRVPRGWNSANAAGLLFAIGVLLFSGGIYAWIFTGQKAFVHLVPIGGILWLCGWLSLAWAGCLCPKCKDVLGERE